MRRTLIAAMFAIAFAVPAHASYSYNFNQTWASPAGLNVQFSYTIGDATGATFHIDPKGGSNGHAGAMFGSMANLLAFEFSFGNFTVDLEDITNIAQKCTTMTTGLCSVLLIDFEFDLRHDTATFNYLDQGLQFWFDGSRGYVATDGRGCATTGLCHYEGNVVAVPEPVSMALLILPLTLLAVRRCRQLRP